MPGTPLRCHRRHPPGQEVRYLVPYAHAQICMRSLAASIDARTHCETLSSTRLHDLRGPDVTSNDAGFPRPPSTHHPPTRTRTRMHALAHEAVPHAPSSDVRTRRSSSSSRVRHGPNEVVVKPDVRRDKGVRSHSLKCMQRKHAQPSLYFEIRGLHGRVTADGCVDITSQLRVARLA